MKKVKTRNNKVVTFSKITAILCKPGTFRNKRKRSCYSLEKRTPATKYKSALFTNGFRVLSYTQTATRFRAVCIRNNTSIYHVSMDACGNFIARYLDSKLTSSAAPLSLTLTLLQHTHNNNNDPSI